MGNPCKPPSICDIYDQTHMRFYWQHCGSAAYIKKQQQIELEFVANVNAMIPSAMMKLYVTEASRLYRKKA